MSFETEGKSLGGKSSGWFNIEEYLEHFCPDDLILEHLINVAESFEFHFVIRNFFYRAEMIIFQFLDLRVVAGSYVKQNVCHKLLVSSKTVSSF